MKLIEEKRFTSAAPSIAVAPENTNAQVADSFTADLVDLRRPLYQRALFLAQDRTAAEDLLQETLERALVSRERFRRGSNLGAWAFSIMRNLFIDGRRRRAIRARLEQKAFWLGLSVVPVSDRGGDGDPRRSENERFDAGAAEPDPLVPLDLLTIDDVNQAVATLPAAQQEIFALAYGERLTYRQIAARLGIPASTTGTRLLRVRTKVRRWLERVHEQRCLDNALGVERRR
jgi:RNA polymerase sigma-70 factor (ECF subfamily)